MLPGLPVDVGFFLELEFLGLLLPESEGLRMAVCSLTILGYRGFATEQTINFAVPTGEPGSGLTVIVGPNNAGKSALLETLGFFGSTEPPSFSAGKRNKKAGDRVRIRLKIDNGQGNTQEYRLETVNASGSECRFSPESTVPSRILVLPPRRDFHPFFGRQDYTRHDYARRIGSAADRKERVSRLEALPGRLIAHLRDEQRLQRFNELLSSVYGYPLKWSIDQSDQGSYFVKFEMNDLFHNSEGAGDGLINVLFIVDALFDSEDGDLIAVDEPELSLHPALQRRLAHLFLEHASRKQIVVSTHSPYFLPIEAVARGAKVARVHVTRDGSTVSQLAGNSASAIEPLLKDLNNPHVFGLDAREIFFIDDRVILVEGQEDVLCYKKLFQQLGESLPGSFFGWGAGGAEKMELIAGILEDLGFQKVVGVLDKDKEQLADRLREQFPSYKFVVSEAPNVRCKPGSPARDPVEGLLDHNGNLREDYRQAAVNLVKQIKAALQGD